MGRIRWKKNKDSYRTLVGSKLHDGTTEFAYTKMLHGGGWYWVCPAMVFGSVKNTSQNPMPSEAEAKAQAMKWVKAKLLEKEKRSGQNRI